MNDNLGVIFDMDGVLIDSEPLHFEACNLILTRHGPALTEEENQSFLGWNESSFWREIVKRFSLPGTVEGYTMERRRIFVQLLENRLPLLPGVKPFIHRLLSRGLKLAVASSSDGELIQQILAMSGLSPLFSALAAGDEVANPKPDPEIFLLAARRLSVTPEACLVFEDSPSGVHAALAAGMEVVRSLSPMTHGLAFPKTVLKVENFQNIDMDELLRP